MRTRTSFEVRRAVLFTVLATLTVSLEAGNLVYVVAGAGNLGLVGGQFGTVDLTTGMFAQIGPVEPDGYFGLAPGSAGSLLSLTYNGDLDAISPLTGVPARIGPTGLSSCLTSSQLCPPTSAFSLGSFEGKIYATDFRNDLFIINAQTAVATLLSDHTGLPQSPFVLGSQNTDGTLNFADEAIWSSGGKLYLTYDAWVFDPATGTSKEVLVPPQLFQIDPASGLATLIGDTDLGIGGAADVNGLSYVFDDITNQIATIDLTTGRTSPAGSFDAAAGVVQGVAPVPEPTPLALGAAGLIVLGILRRCVLATDKEVKSRAGTAHAETAARGTNPTHSEGTSHFI